MENTNTLAGLAKSAVTHFIESKEVAAVPKNFPKQYLKKRAGAFVTLRLKGELRGCIGTYLPTKGNIALEVVANAIAAATEDPRFEPVGKDELADLSYEVYVLEKPEAVKSLDELDPKIFGVIVLGARSRRSALLLPGLEGIDTVWQQLACVCQKAGIDPAFEKLVVQKFRAKKIG